MGTRFSPGDVATRIRGILGRLDPGAIQVAAQRLEVSEVALRISIDEIEPHPAMEVLLAIVMHHGIDPTWLLTGEYDPATHRAAINDGASISSGDLAALMARQMTPPLGTDSVTRGNSTLEA